ncbi:hypothetical protein K461DRAFT_143838 [Myriangium duriaei CBS 260.36]|uniref:Uncharacterized protein n=1 Tax=Myriangium duriaei CBS 260.36 TaxID=1168546 RepID=A0A9P4IYK4_9PEZI|nr:hypothetical protein K461DRAFT_143838 [Myriangium duriaei CBS 260.36]
MIWQVPLDQLVRLVSRPSTAVGKPSPRAAPRISCILVSIPFISAIVPTEGLNYGGDSETVMQERRRPFGGPWHHIPLWALARCSRWTTKRYGTPASGLEPQTNELSIWLSPWQHPLMLSWPSESLDLTICLTCLILISLAARDLWADDHYLQGHLPPMKSHSRRPVGQKVSFPLIRYVLYQ